MTTTTTSSVGGPVGSVPIGSKAHDLESIIETAPAGRPGRFFFSGRRCVPEAERLFDETPKGPGGVVLSS